ncbi:MAG: hypothetical protein PGN07_11165 [Aeromicrobium erythreum]
MRLPSSALAVGGSTPVRRAGPEDAAAVHAVHDRAVSRRNGPLSRTGELFDEPPTLRVDGISVAERDGTVVGYASWDRGRGYGEGAELVVHDVEADDADALASLLTVLGSFASTVPAVRIRTSGLAPWQHLVRTVHPVPVSSTPYALAVLDVRAFEVVSAPPGLDVRLPFAVDGTAHALQVADGRVQMTPAEHAERRLTRGGLALTFAGAHTAADLRVAGHLAGPTDDDAAWDALTLRGPVHVPTTSERAHWKSRERCRAGSAPTASG